MLVFLYSSTAHKHLEYPVQSVKMYSPDVLPEGNIRIPCEIFSLSLQEPSVSQCNFAGEMRISKGQAHMFLILFMAFLTDQCSNLLFVLYMGVICFTTKPVMLSLVLLRWADSNKPRIGKKNIFSSNKKGFDKMRVLFNCVHAKKEKGMEEGLMCCFSSPSLVKAAPCLCVDKSLGNVPS